MKNICTANFSHEQKKNKISRLARTSYPNVQASENRTLFEHVQQYKYMATVSVTETRYMFYDMYKQFL